VLVFSHHQLSTPALKVNLLANFTQEQDI
jgi:hypothetical protein